MDDVNYLYHYTSLESLECILSNESIRLKPLSTLDDMEEALSEDCQAIGNYVFVSSWSSESKEMIPMWYMYGNEYKGVRIGLPKNPFKDYHYSVKEQIDAGIIPTKNQALVVDLPLSDINNPRYIIAPWKREAQLKEVLYTDEESRISPVLWSENKELITFSYGKMGIYKNDYWSFQKEWRYIVNVLPISLEVANDYVQKSPEKLISFFERISSGEIPCPIDSYDLSIKHDALSKMEIVVGPLMSENDIQRVYEIVNKKDCSIMIRTSELKGRIRSL